MGEAIARSARRVQGDTQAGWASPMRIGEARARGKVMSAGHSLRRQNYSFPVTVTPPTPHASGPTHFMRIAVAVATAAALNIALVASVSVLIAGR